MRAAAPIGVGTKIIYDGEILTIIEIFPDKCVLNAEGSVDVGSASGSGAVQEMKDCWPFGAALWGEASNRHMLRER